MILARPSRGDERSGIVASDYIVYLFASIEIRRQRVLPGSVYIILSSNESAYVLTHRETGVMFFLFFFWEKSGSINEFDIPVRKKVKSHIFRRHAKAHSHFWVYLVVHKQDGTAWGSEANLSWQKEEPRSLSQNDRRRVFFKVYQSYRKGRESPEVQALLSWVFPAHSW